MDAQALFREGVLAIRDQKDLVRGQQCLTQSLELDPTNDLAWLWLTRTVNDPHTKLQYVDKALSINPTNEHALKLKARLDQHAVPAPSAPPAAPAKPVAPAPAVSGVIQPLAPKTMDTPLTDTEIERIASLMESADSLVDNGDIEGAIGQWVQVLKIRVDYELAMRNASGHLWRMSYVEDARELVHRAIEAGTSVSSIYLTGIDMAERERDHDMVEAIQQRIALTPNVDDKLVITIADQFLEDYKLEQARQFLETALEGHPNSQPILMKMAAVLESMHRPEDAQPYYERVVKLGARTSEGKQADKKLLRVLPVLTDRERGSFVLAVREALAFGLVFLLLAWQDARLDLSLLGGMRWIGIGLGLAGGYFLVTATSSPQQRPLARLLFGKVPDPKPEDKNDDGKEKLFFGKAREAETHIPIIPKPVRIVLAVAGLAMIVGAFILVFNDSLNLVFDYEAPKNPYFDEY